MSYREVQCDGLIGPTHNYAGLSFGNVASESNAEGISYPKQAALQGLEKMRFVHQLGCPQVILPPPLRPNTGLMNRLGIHFDSSKEDIFKRQVIRAAWSASTMWSANAAMVSPAPDTSDNRMHFTIANLASGLHRSQEAEERHLLFRHIFHDVAEVHPALPSCAPFTDEGAANHMRLAPSHGEAGIEIMVYGRDETGIKPSRYPARQTRLACQAIAKLHQLPEERVVFTQQHPEAIDAGVFHNDVIAMSNLNVMIYHEYSFLHEAALLEELKRKTSFPLALIRISNEELPLKEAVQSYFYNSQLLDLPDGRMVIVAPTETRDNPFAHAAMMRIRDANDNPVSEIHYLDVRESMKNGGGPACLRLRVVMQEEDIKRIPEPYLFNASRFDMLSAFIKNYYPDMLTPDMLYDVTLAEKMHKIHDELMKCFAS